MDLTGYKIFDIYGIKNITLSGHYDSDSLAQKLIDEWVPYIDCGRKCPKSDYCKYTKPNPYHPDILTDVKCGIGVDTLRNFTRSTFHILEKLSPENVENYLEGAFYLSQFVLSAEATVGTCINKYTIEWWDTYAPAVFGHVTKLRDQLNKLGSVFQHIPEFRSANGVLFVEGWTEKEFLEKLRESHSFWFLHLNIEVYDGSGNRRPKRIQMLLDNYVKLGYKIYIQGDADGKNSEIFNELVRKGSVTEDCTFVFKYDFESSVPLDLLLQALQALEEIPEVKLDDFVNKLSPLDCSVVKKIKEVFGIDLDPLKLDTATIIAENLNNPRWAWWQDEKFMQTELGKFIRFVQDMI